MCGRRSRRLSIILFYLCFSLLASYSEDLSGMTTEALVTRLTEISEERKSLQNELQLSLGSLKTQSEILETGLAELERTLSGQETVLEGALTRLTSLESQLTELKEPQEELRRSLEDMTSSTRNLRESFRSYSEEQEQRLSSLRTQNIILTVLTVIASGIAVTALVLN